MFRPNWLSSDVQFGHAVCILQVLLPRMFLSWYGAGVKHMFSDAVFLLEFVSCSCVWQVLMCSLLHLDDKEPHMMLQYSIM
jgi:membrane protein implicated in regulation of membrane protease activity